MIIKTCLKCGRYFLRGGRSFTIHCAEGRVETVYLCRACSAVIALRSAISYPEVQAA